MSEPVPPRLTVPDHWFNRLVIGAVAVGFLALVVIGGVATWLVFRMEEQSRMVNHTYEVERTIARFRTLSEQAEAARRGYLLAPAPAFLASLDVARRDLPDARARLRALVQDNPRQKVELRRLDHLSEIHRRILAASLKLADQRRAGVVVSAMTAPGNTGTIGELRKVTERMRAEENRLLDIRNRAVAQGRQAFFVTLSIAGVLLLLVALSSLWLILRYTRDLGRSRNLLAELNDNLEATVVERTADLSRANQEIQRFAYIVSHDLRSPLVNVMGFTAELEASTGTLRTLVDTVEAEAPALVSEDAALAAREDLPEAIGFIRSSTQKMDRLINAILRLSREGRRVIAPERLDMVSLLGGIRDSLAHRLSEVDGRIEIEKPLPTIVSDRVAMEQVFSNLIENAVKYAAPGRPPLVTIRARRDGPRILYEVQDNGRGIDPRDHDRVFDLFRRSGVQDQPGEGIGLAHVRALVYRLGGTIQCQSALGEGATFRISLPAIIAGDQGAPA